MKAVITGASRGIGEAIARALAHEGYDLILTCDKTFDVLEKVAADIRATYNNIEINTFCIDMADENAVNELFEKIGDIDLLINNAGISYVGLLHEMTSEQWHRVMGVNLDSIFYTSRAALIGMIKKHSGRIINISSIWGNTGASMEVAYSASKGAVNTFTKALAKEVAPSGITVNAISCGVIDTDMNKCFSKEEMDAFVEEIPADRMGTADEVARMAVLISKAPEYMTGQVITIDGAYQ